MGNPVISPNESDLHLSEGSKKAHSICHQLLSEIGISLIYLSKLPLLVLNQFQMMHLSTCLTLSHEKASLKVRDFASNDASCSSHDHI